MFVSKVNSLSNQIFKGYQHVKNDVGENALKLFYPFDSEKETCEFQIYRVTPSKNYSYTMDSNPYKTVQIEPNWLREKLLHTKS
ncbi:MAG: hypothetical protein MJ231_03100 [bacterium]|nr:hypothetical protein [bacterium]